MRLSEPRIDHITGEMLKQLEKSGAIQARGDRRIIQNRLGKVILDDLQIEDSIEREARERLRRMPSAPPESSPEYEALLRREKEGLAFRKGYVI